MIHICRVFLAAAFVLALACAATAQVAILQIRVIEGEGAVHAPGSRSTRPLTVEVTDETGKPVEGAAVSFHLPEEGPGGVFANGMRTEVAVTDSHGQASVHGLQLNRTSGRFLILIVASKEQARAGMASFQYIAEPGSGAARSGHRRQLPRKSKVDRGGAAGGRRRGGGDPVGGKVGGSAAPSAPSAPPAPVPTIILTIGAPTITVGKP